MAIIHGWKGIRSQLDGRSEPFARVGNIMVASSLLVLFVRRMILTALFCVHTPDGIKLDLDLKQHLPVGFRMI